MARTAHCGLFCLLVAPLLAHAQLCEFECPNGALLTARDDFAPTTNGCGVSGLKIKSAFDFTACCDEHDLCFQRCGASFETCNSEFQACMEGMCEKEEARESCESTAMMYSMGVSFGGCSFFQDSQRAGCDCGDGYEPPEEGAAGSVARSVHGEEGEPELDLGMLLEGLGDIFGDIAEDGAGADLASLGASPEEADGPVHHTPELGGRDEL